MRELLGAIESGEVGAGPSQRHRVEGAITALEALLDTHTGSGKKACAASATSTKFREIRIGEDGSHEIRTSPRRVRSPEQMKHAISRAVEASNC